MDGAWYPVEDNLVKARCPYCDQYIQGTPRDIDSGLRKHMEYCVMAPDSDT